MEEQFSSEEIGQIVRAARVLAPGFRDDDFKSIVTTQKHLGDTRFCQAAWGLARLEKEKGISCSEALDTYQKLLEDKVRLESQVASLRKTLSEQQGKSRGEEEKRRRLGEEIKQAEGELRAVRNERQKTERGLAAFRRESVAERVRIERELDEYRKQAKVTQADIQAVAELKQSLAKHGFSLDMVISLSEEFVGHENAREELGQDLEQHGSLTNCLAALEEEAQAKKESHEAELKAMSSEKRRQQAEIEGLTASRTQLRETVSQLQANVDHENTLRGFYQRYSSLAPLLDHLASWKQVIFLRCNNPVAFLIGATRFWTNDPAVKCPHCGTTSLAYDAEVYQSLRLPVGQPLKLELK